MNLQRNVGGFYAQNPKNTVEIRKKSSSQNRNNYITFCDLGHRMRLANMG